MNKITVEELALYIDHTILSPVTTKAQVEEYCKQAIEYRFASVCINPCNVKTAYNILKGTNVNVCTVIGFPLGSNTTDVKAYEAKEAVLSGAKEIDMVINIGALKDGDIQFVKKDIIDVKSAINGAILKVIIETCFLTDEEKKLMCKIVKEAGADFIKTSTGFGSGGAIEEDIKLMKECLGDSVKIKASGGIRTYEDTIIMINAGANRIGTSSGIKIVKGI